MLQVGEKLFWNGSRSKWEPSEVEVAKVGRKWATLVNSWGSTRVDLATLELDGPRAYGRLWRSEQHWREHTEAEAKLRASNAAWDDFRKTIASQWQRPKHLDPDAIARIRAIIYPPEEQKSDG